MAVYIAATLTKAWEPLSVAIAAHGRQLSTLPPFAAVLVVCEAIKLAAGVAALRSRPPRLCTQLLSRASFRRFGVPAAFLALTNHVLGFAVPRLDPILYQTLFKGVNVMATALLTSLWRPLGTARWSALATLLVGCFLALPDPSSSDDERHFALKLSNFGLRL